MKRIFLLLFVLSLFSGLRASDTLTIRQIYNFDVGDTFDYLNYSTETGNFGGPGPYDTTTFYYQRNLVINKTIASDSITYIVSNTTYISDTVFDFQMDTVLLTQIDSNIIDTQLVFFSTNYLFPFRDVGNQDRCVLIDSAYLTNIPNWDSLDNDVRGDAANGASAWFVARFQKGLGMTYSDGTNNDGVDGIFDYYTILVYYSKGNTHAGTPYYNSTLGINNLSNISDAKVYPNPVSDLLTLSITNGGQIDPQFIITDILGRQVYSSAVTQAESSFDISGFSSGLYTWRIGSDGAVIKTGKVIKE